MRGTNTARWGDDTFADAGRINGLAHGAVQIVARDWWELRNQNRPPLASDNVAGAGEGLPEGA